MLKVLRIIKEKTLDIYNKIFHKETEQYLSLSEFLLYEKHTHTKSISRYTLYTETDTPVFIDGINEDCIVSNNYDELS